MAIVNQLEMCEECSDQTCAKCSWVRSDFRAELIKAELWDENREDDESALYTLFRAACEKANEYPIHESGGNVHWNIERIVDKIDAAFIERLEKHNPDQLQLGVWDETKPFQHAMVGYV